jgi:hypothetical protein
LLVFNFITAAAKLPGINMDVHPELAAGIVDWRAREGIFDSIAARAPERMRVSRIPHPIHFDVNVLAQGIGTRNRNGRRITGRSGKRWHSSEYLPAVMQAITVGILLVRIRAEASFELIV